MPSHSTNMQSHIDKDGKAVNYVKRFQQQKNHMDVEMEIRKLKLQVADLQRTVAELSAKINDKDENELLDVGSLNSRNFSLSMYHEIKGVPHFKDVNLNTLYANFHYTGAQISKRIHGLIRFMLLNITVNPIYPWGFTISSKPLEGFTIIPLGAYVPLCEVILDSLNLGLPSEFERNELMMSDLKSHSFYKTLGEDDVERELQLQKIKAARSKFKIVISNSLSTMLTYIREYHFDRKSARLISCKNKQCESHLTWKKVKSSMERSGNSNIIDELDAQLRMFMEQ